MLYATERVDTPLAQLESIGRTDLLRNLRALKRACADYAPQQGVENCVLKMNLDKPEAGPVAEARKQLVMLRQFVVDKKLVSMPSDELALVNEAPPFNGWNSAYIDIPGPSRKGMPSTYSQPPHAPTRPKPQPHTGSTPRRD